MEPLILYILLVAISIFYSIISETDEENYRRCADILILLWHVTIFHFLLYSFMTIPSFLSVLTAAQH